MEKRFLLISFLCLLIIRLFLLNINEGEYTDGILLINQFSEPNDIYPPFYSLLAFIFGGFGNWLEFGGKIVSALFSSLLIFPLYKTAEKISDKKSAQYSCLLYIVAPIPLRWGIRVMSDALFSFIFLSSFYFFILYYINYFSNQSSRNKENERNLVIGIILSILATLTHYRGIILLPVSLISLLLILIRDKQFNIRIFFAHFLWLFIPLWIFLRGFRHFTQIEERMAGSFIETFFNYFNNFESFVLLFPYFLTYPTAFFVLYGLFKGKILLGNKKVFFFITFLLTAQLLVLQSVFSSFQSRYLLPIIPLLLIIGGIGIEEFRKNILDFKYQRKLFKYFLYITMIWGIVFSLSVCYFQKGAFGDLKSAGKYIKSLNYPKNKIIFSNEFYKEDLTGIKLAFWSGNKINMVKDYRNLPPGSILVLHSAYGGRTNFIDTQNNLANLYRLKVLKRFESKIIPLLPEIMEEPGTHQNPAAWIFRYRQQKFETVVYEIIDKNSNFRLF